MSDTIIQRIHLGPTPDKNNWNDSCLVKLTKAVQIGVVVGSSQSRAASSMSMIAEDSETSDEDELTAAKKVGSTLVKLDPHSPYFIKTKCIDETSLQIRLVEMLRATIPPKIWEFEGKVYFQEALTKAITRKEVTLLREKFGRLLVQRRSTKFGLCAVRKEILHQAMDELIRQALMVAPERGLSLIRIKNELELTILAYNAAASQAFFYKHVPDPLKKTDLDNLRTKFAELEDDILLQKKKIRDLQQVIDELKITLADSVASRQFYHGQQKLQFERNITQLKLHLKALEVWGYDFMNST